MPIAGLTFIEIVTAVNAYYMDYVEYGKYPLDSSKQGYDPCWVIRVEPMAPSSMCFARSRTVIGTRLNVLNPRRVFPGSGCKSPLEAKERVATQDTTSANGSTIKMAA